MTRLHLNLTLLATAVALVLPSPAGAQILPAGKTAAELIREDTLRTGNNHRRYECTDLHDTPAPRGYKPFYISHYGRHGSRSDHQEEPWVRMEKQLRPAYEQGMLTYKGARAYEKVVEMCKASEGMRGMLTETGVREHAGIARRMYGRFPEVFKKGRGVDAKSSTVQRCIVSMASFTTALASCAPGLEFDILTGENYMEYIGNVDGFGEATEGSDKMLSDYKKTLSRDSTSFLAIMFKDPEEGHRLLGDAYHFQKDLVSTANYCQCFDIEDVFHRCMPFEVYYDSWSLKNRSLYLKHCNSEEFGDRRMPIMRKLAGDILERADAAVAGNGRAADLRFGHDYPLMGLGGYLDLEGPGGRWAFDEIDDNWFGSWYICMASNLQIVFYRNKAGDVLVKCLWNERETRINGLEPLTGPYYRWEDLRAYWAGRFPEDRYPLVKYENPIPAPGI